MQVVDLSLKGGAADVVFLENTLEFLLKDQFLLRGVVVGLVDLVEQLGKGTS
jgi:hypothetical protein